MDVGLVLHLDDAGFFRIGVFTVSVPRDSDGVGFLFLEDRQALYPYFEFSKKYPELLLKTEFKSTEEIVSLVKMLCMEICSHVEQSNGPPAQAEFVGNGSDNIHEILAFIKENYADQSFSAKLLADHFQMSISNFSHYFKKQTGRVVSAYISALRYERAKELLRTTNLPVAEIAGQSGYCHISTFMRQFKNQEGITPSTYRNQYRFVSLGNQEEAAGTDPAERPEEE
ncbi:MAG: helix-turn-helix transcriptional regulator [Provencibacterium sp.]|nr:helix-turn-helix transcriptional regulator [Provencibacterium sp.]